MVVVEQVLTDEGQFKAVGGLPGKAQIEFKISRNVPVRKIFGIERGIVLIAVDDAADVAGDGVQLQAGTQIK